MARKTKIIFTDIDPIFSNKFVMLISRSYPKISYEYREETQELELNSLTKEQKDKINEIYNDVLNIFRTRKINEAKQIATEIINNKWPLFKQLNCANGIYDKKTCDRMKNDINQIRELVDEFETYLNSLKSQKEILSTNFKDFYNERV